MPGREPRAEAMNDEFDLPMRDWATAEARLSTGTSVWIASVRPDGRPHVMPVLPIWLDGALWFSTSHTSQQTRNMTTTPHVVISIRDDEMELVVEGQADRVTDDATLSRVRDRYAEQQGWPVDVVDGALEAPYKAPTAGAMPFFVFRITPIKAFALPLADNFTPTRWTF